MHRSAVFSILIIASLRGYASDPCSEAYETGGMVGWKVCQAESADGSRSELESVYDSLVNELVYPEYLKSSQLQWNIYAEKHCEFIATGAQGGSGHGAILSQCQNEMFKKRAEELRQYLGCRDTGCPPLKD